MNSSTNESDKDGSWSVSGSYSDLDRKQDSYATVGQGVLRVRNDEETGTDSTVGLNRDIDTAQVVTKDKETGFDLYVSSTAIDSIEGLFQKDENGNNKTLSLWADNITSIFDPESYQQMMGNVAEMTNPAKLAAAWEQAKTTVGLVKVTLPDTSGLDAALQEKINLAQQQGQEVEFLSSDGTIQVVQIGDTTFAVGEKIINEMENSLTAYANAEEKWNSMALRDAESQQAVQDSDFDAQQRNNDRFYQALGESNANNRDGYNTGLNLDNTTGTLTDYSDWRSPQAHAFDAIYGTPAGTTLGQLGQIGGSMAGGFAHFAYDSGTDLVGLALTGAYLYNNPVGGISGLLSGGTPGGQFATGAQSRADDYVSSFGSGSFTGGFGNEDIKSSLEIVSFATGLVSAGGVNAGNKVVKLGDDLPNNLTAAERSASFQGSAPYEGIDSLKNIELSEGKRIAHVTFSENGRPVSEYFTTESAIRRATLQDGSIDANALNQGLQIHPGVDPLTGLQRPDFKPFVQFFETTQNIPMGQVAFGRTLANPALNPDGHKVLPQLFINKEYHQFLNPLEIQQTTNTKAPLYVLPKGN